MHSIVFSSSSIFITLIMVCIQIVFLELLLKHKKMYKLYRFDFLAVLALMIIIRIMIPFEMPFTVTWNIGLFMNSFIEWMDKESLFGLQNKQMLMAIWGIVALILFFVQSVRLRKAKKNFQIIYDKAKKKHISDYGITQNKDYEVVISKAIPYPMVVGRQARIFLPDIQLSESEMQHILDHEIHHIRNHDIFIKQLIELIRVLYWWFLPVYVLRRDIHLILEMQ